MIYIKMYHQFRLKGTPSPSALIIFFRGFVILQHYLGKLIRKNPDRRYVGFEADIRSYQAAFELIKPL